MEATLSVLANVNGIMEFVEVKPSPEQQMKAERVSQVEERLISVLNDEGPTVATTALVGTLARLLAFNASDPSEAARETGQVLQAKVQQYLLFNAVTEMSSADDGE